MKARDRRDRHETGPGHERWLVSYADFITLMFALFTVLYAGSTVDRGKLVTVAGSFQRVFDGRAPTRTGVGEGTEAVVDPLVALHAGLAAELRGEVAAGKVAIARDRRGLVVSIQEAGTFRTGSDELPAPALAVLDIVAGRLRGIPNAVRVEGHTDDLPIRSPRFASNWDLSTARATRVVAHLVEQARLDPARLSAAGYGEFHPATPNDGPRGRARNRRVDIVVLNVETSRAEEPPRDPR